MTESEKFMIEQIKRYEKIAESVEKLQSEVKKNISDLKKSLKREKSKKKKKSRSRSKSTVTYANSIQGEDSDNDNPGSSTQTKTKTKSKSSSKEKEKKKHKDKNKNKTTSKKHVQDNVVIYTDGSCKGGKIKKCGYGVYFPDGKVHDISEPFTKRMSPYTNQRAELYAILSGMEKAFEKYEFKTLTIHSDSMYSINCSSKWITNWKKNGWKTANKSDVKNKDILKKIDKFMTKYGHKIKFEHVKGHSGIAGNERADQLANEGADRS